MKTKGKVLALGLSAAALVAASVFGTMAYLTDTEAVTNTFTVGRVGLSLDELDVDNDDNTKDNVTVDGKTRDKANEYHLLPGHTYTKDPTVHINNESESCWVFVKVENGIAAIEEDDADYATVEKQIEKNGWKLVTGETNVYYQACNKSSAVIGEATSDLIVFSEFAIDGDNVDATKLAEYADAKIVVTAYAVQLDGFENNSSGAWAAVKAEYFPTTP